MLFSGDVINIIYFDIFRELVPSLLKVSMGNGISLVKILPFTQKMQE